MTPSRYCAIPLSDASIRKAHLSDLPRKLYESRSLYLEIAPCGSKAGPFKYRLADREKRISLVLYPEVPLKLARQRRDEARRCPSQAENDLTASST